MLISMPCHVALRDDADFSLLLYFRCHRFDLPLFADDAAIDAATTLFDAFICYFIIFFFFFFLPCYAFFCFSMIFFFRDVYAAIDIRP